MLHIHTSYIASTGNLIIHAAVPCMGVCLRKLYIYTVNCNSCSVAAVNTNRSYPKWLEIALPEVRYLHAKCKQFGIIIILILHIIICGWGLKYMQMLN